MQHNDKIYIAGHRGLAGSAIARNLETKGFKNIITRTSGELDLRRQTDVERFFAMEKPDIVFLAAAKVGGIHANNTYRADFLYENLQIQNNVIYSAFRNDAQKLIFLGSSCIYPKMAPQPLKEEYLLTGSLEATNEPYAIAKIAGIKLCETLRDQYGFNAIACMPTNLYGPNDNFDLQTSHVLQALVRKFHEAKENGSPHVTLWGTGAPLREFLHVNDAADAMVFLAQHYNEKSIVNVGTGMDISIKDLGLLIKDIVGFQGDLKWDNTKPDGTPRKLLNVEKLHALGWRHSIDLRAGIADIYRWFRDHFYAAA